jgi:hypothetical protein
MEPGPERAPMSFEIDNIDRICRKIGQDVLLLAFLDEEAESLDLYVDIDPITTWLEAEGLQAICTRVSHGDECSIIIVDGAVGEVREDKEISFA